MGAREAHPGRLATEAIRTLAPYVPGKPSSELERELGIEDIIKLASNENPWGPSPRARAAIEAALAEVWLYPDGSCHALKRALARHLGVEVERVSVGNGSNELLMLLAEAFLTPAHSAVYAQYGFAIYPLVIRETGARAIEVPALAAGPMRYGADLTAMAAAITADTRLVFIANPNNPTGTWVGAADLKRFIERAPPSTLVILDEAYVEYGREQGTTEGLGWLDEHPNLVILRTFSKAYGLAGMRVGYAISHVEVADVLNRLRPAFNVNSLAQAAAIAALEDQAHMRHCVAETVRGMRELRAGYEALGLEYAASAANFLLVRVGAAAAVYQALLREGIIARPVAGYGLGEHLRISVGLPEHNQRLLQALPRHLARA